MKHCMKIFICFLYIPGILILYILSVCHASQYPITICNHHDYVYTKNHPEKKIYIFNNTSDIKNKYQHDYNYPIKYSHQYINNEQTYIPKYNYQISSPLNYKNNYKSQIHIQNDSINILHIFNKCLDDFKYEKLISFMQIGIQNFLSEKTVILGGGKKCAHNTRHIIGYNALFHCPIFNQSLQPYSINIGGEYWYKNINFILNSYYNINNIIYSRKPEFFCYYQYPKIGYQIGLRSKFPYISECQYQIIWEQYTYDQENKQLLNNIQNTSHSLLIGIGYNPIPIFKIDINNIFLHNRYHDTSYTITLNYQFNIPLKEQINHKYYNSNQLILKNLNTITQPFIPIAKKHSLIDTENIIIDASQPIYEITGYPGEIKFIQIQNNTSCIKWDPLSFQQQGGKILNLKNNIYVFYFPNTSQQSAEISLCYEDQKNNILKESKILCITKSNIKKQNLLKERSESPCYITLNNHRKEETQLNSITNTTVSSSSSVVNQCDQQLNNSIISDNTNNIVKNENNDNKHNKNNDMDVLTPPPPPPLPMLSECFTTPLTQKQYFEPSTSSKPTSQKFEENLTLGKKTHDDHSISTMAPKNDLHINTNLKSSKDINISDLFHKLSEHKKTKFASVGTNEYVEKLEKSLIQRKKDKCTSDIEKILNKLHIASSQSSLDNMSINTDNDSNNSNNFSITSNN